jgi:hypothetical protein
MYPGTPLLVRAHAQLVHAFVHFELNVFDWPMLMTEIWRKIVTNFGEIKTKLNTK